MENEFKINEHNIVNVLLEGAVLSSFTFHTHFELRFSCERNKNTYEKQLPFEIVLSIPGVLWFGNKNEWDGIVGKMTSGDNYIEPDEPVLAFKLAALRWKDGAVITSVNLSPEKLELKFACGECINISNIDEIDYAWEINEYNPKDISNSWSVECYNGEISYNVPK